jgi:D-alanyl-D-alanine carboxypeptidase
MDAAFDRFEQVTMLHAEEVVHTMPVDASDALSVDIILSADLTGVVPKGSLPQVEIDLPTRLEAPIRAGQPLGTARMTVHGITFSEVPLVAADNIARDDFPARWLMYWRNWLGTPAA